MRLNAGAFGRRIRIHGKHQQPVPTLVRQVDAHTDTAEFLRRRRRHRLQRNVRVIDRIDHRAHAHCKLLALIGAGVDDLAPLRIGDLLPCRTNLVGLHVQRTQAGNRPIVIAQRSLHIHRRVDGHGWYGYNTPRLQTLLDIAAQISAAGEQKYGEGEGKQSA